MILSAAKNHKIVTVVCRPEDYNSVVNNLRVNNSETSPDLSLRLTAKVLEETGRYDVAIGGYLLQELSRRK